MPANKPPFDGEWVRLGDVCKVVGGSTPKTDDPGNWGGDIKWVTPAEIRESVNLVTDTLKHVTPQGVRAARLRIMPAGTVLLTTRAPIGKVALAGDEMCCNQGFKCLICSSEISNEWLLRLLRYKSCELQQMGTGATFRELSKKVVSSYRVKLPAMASQLLTVERLSSLEKLLGVLRRQLVLLDQLVKSRFVEMFGDPKLESNKWSTKTLGEVCATRLGKMLDAKKQTGTCSYPYLANTNVQWFHFDLTDLRQMDFSDEDRIEFGLKNGDIMVTEGGEIGRCAIWREEIPNCYFQKAVHRVRCDSEVLLPEYFVWCFKMKADLGLFESYVSQSTIAHLTGKKIKQVPIPLPPLALQQEFADFVAEVDKSRFIVQQKIEKLQTLYDSLAQEYFG